MSFSQNGWTVIHPNNHVPADTHAPRLRTFAIQDVGHIPMRDGSAGFVLAHFAAWYADNIERVLGPQRDDWGYAYRPIAGSTVFSNHASGTAIDLNSLKHPRGVRNTFPESKRKALNARLDFYGVITGGYLWHNPDDMHFELSDGTSLAQVEKVARRLMSTLNGRILLANNPGLREYILS